MGESAGTTDSYQPGVCNIGTEERRRRRRVGHLGTAAGLFVLVAIGGLGLPAYYGLASTVFFIAGAIGYLQDRFRFCAHYGRQGEFNLGGLDAEPEQVDDETARKKDRRRARQISIYGIVVGIGAGVVGWLVLSLL